MVSGLGFRVVRQEVCGNPIPCLGLFVKRYVGTVNPEC